MVLGALIIAAVALVVVAAVAWPLLFSRPEAPSERAETDARRDLDQQLELSLEAIREIEMDHRAGNLSDEDFAALDTAERARAVELMRRSDEMGPEGEKP